MKNANELRSELSKLFYKLKNNESDIAQAKTMVATSNAILKSAQLELEHSRLTGNTSEIPFLKS